MSDHDQIHSASAVGIIRQEDNKDEAANNDDQQQLHSLPCRIDYTGSACVSKFFHVKSLDDGVTKVAAFRGHLLFGQTIKMPDGYKIYVLEEENEDIDKKGKIYFKNKSKSLDDSSDGSLKCKKTFKVRGVNSSMDFWEYDEMPCLNKNTFNAFAVLNVTKDLAS